MDSEESLAVMHYVYGAVWLLENVVVYTGSTGPGLKNQ